MAKKHLFSPNTWIHIAWALVLAMPVWAQNQDNLKAYAEEYDSFVSEAIVQGQVYNKKLTSKQTSQLVDLLRNERHRSYVHDIEKVHEGHEVAVEIKLTHIDTKEDFHVLYDDVLGNVYILIIEKVKRNGEIIGYEFRTGLTQEGIQAWNQFLLDLGVAPQD